MNNIALKQASTGDYPALYGILQVCGEHMHRTQGLSHWYPYRPFETYIKEIADGTVYAIYDDTLLIGTFYLTPTMRPHYTQIGWSQDDNALYHGGMGILPFAQGRGIGNWGMHQADILTRDGGYDAFRFDAISNNARLLRFYKRLGYEQRGVVEFSDGEKSSVTCYERVLG